MGFSRMISIIIPIIRLKKAERCIEAIHQNAGIDNYEIITEIDKERIGCPKMVKTLVNRTRHDLVCFVGDDTIPQPDFLKNALKKMNEFDGGWGLVGLNDGHNEQTELATHWLGHKKLLPFLDGEFFCTEYKHCFCDNELTERSKIINRYVYAKDAVIEHDHPIFKKTELTDDYKRVYALDYIIHDKLLFGQRRKLWKQH